MSPDPYRFAKPGEGGGSTGYVPNWIEDVDGDAIVENQFEIPFLADSNGDEILQGLFSCFDPLVDDTSTIITSSDEEPILVRGNCKGNILTRGNLITTR